MALSSQVVLDTVAFTCNVDFLCLSCRKKLWLKPGRSKAESLQQGRWAICGLSGLSGSCLTYFGHFGELKMFLPEADSCA